MREVAACCPLTLSAKNFACIQTGFSVLVVSPKPLLLALFRRHGLPAVPLKGAVVSLYVRRKDVAKRAVGRTYARVVDGMGSLQERSTEALGTFVVVSEFMKLMLAIRVLIQQEIDKVTVVFKRETRHVHVRQWVYDVVVAEPERQ